MALFKELGEAVGKQWRPRLDTLVRLFTDECRKAAEEGRVSCEGEFKLKVPVNQDFSKLLQKELQAEFGDPSGTCHITVRSVPPRPPSTDSAVSITASWAARVPPAKRRRIPPPHQFHEITSDGAARAWPTALYEELGEAAGKQWRPRLDTAVRLFTEECRKAAAQGRLSCSGEFKLKVPVYQDFRDLLQKELQAELCDPSSTHRITVRSLLPRPSSTDSVISISASWAARVPPSKRRKTSKTPSAAIGSVVRPCPICLAETEPVLALTPCGHLVCTTCSKNFEAGKLCPTCRQEVRGHQRLFG